MKKLVFGALLSVFFFAFAGVFPAQAQLEIGAPAPVFETVDINGEAIALSDFIGQTVVLEWTNHECPFVVKHYITENMQNLQKTAAEHNVVWLSIVSSAPENQGYISPEEARAILAENSALPSAKILDPSGEIGHLYEAKTTPHMFIIDPQGILVYNGAIDDNTSARPESVEGAHNYVLAALKEIAQGQPVSVPQTAPYGCSVKY